MMVKPSVEPFLPTTDGAIATVRAFLAAMQERDLVQAATFLSDGFTMTFPGGIQFTRLEDLVLWSKPRYLFVEKTYIRFQHGIASDSPANSSVTCFGTLHGEWADGVPFAGIRFCDWFLIGADQKLLVQEVWNDMAIFVDCPSRGELAESSHTQGPVPTAPVSKLRN